MVNALVLFHKVCEPERLMVIIVEKHIWSEKLTKDIEHIRTVVFVEEQGFTPEIVFDELDARALHVALYENELPIASARTVKESPGIYRFGRIAVLREKRGLGLGALIMQIMEDKMKEIGAAKIILSAQSHGQGFYEKCGYNLAGEEYLIHDCPHINMEKDLAHLFKALF